MTLVSAGVLVLAIVALAAIVGFVGLYVFTRGDYTMPPTVVDDPSLPRIDVGDTAFHAEAIGDSDAAAIIVLHGGPGGDYRSLEVLRKLANERLVVFYDQRGSGLSQRVPAEGLTYESAIEDLDGFVERFGRGQPVDLIGHSWGATLAVGYLAAHPETVRRAVLAEPGYLTAAEESAWRSRYARLMSGLRYRWLALRAGFEAQHLDGPDDYAARDYLVGERVIPYFANHPDNPYHCPGRAYDSPRWRWGALASDVLSGAAMADQLDDAAKRAAVFERPVLFLAGACNSWIGPGLQERHSKLFRTARVVVIDDVGHDMFWDAPEPTLEAIRAFLTEDESTESES